MVYVEDILDLPLRVFYRLPSRMSSTFSRYVYLLNDPILGMHPKISKDKILIGTKGFVHYLNVLSYSLGYIIETPPMYTFENPSYLVIGSITSEHKHIGPIKTLYCDSNLTILQNKKHSSYLITGSYLSDIPQPINLEELHNARNINCN